METEMKEIRLATLGKGAAEERFAEELRKVLDNIADVNTPAKATREITICVRFYPREERDFADMEITSSAKLAKLAGFESRVHIGPVAGEVKAFEEVVKQGTLPLGNVTDIASGREK